MKLSLSAAMRARDVSRPHAGHLAEAASAEPAPTMPKAGREAGREAGPKAAPTRSPRAEAAPTQDEPPRPRRTRNRNRKRPGA